MTNTQTIANQFGDFEPLSSEIQAQIERLGDFRERESPMVK